MKIKPVYILVIVCGCFLLYDFAHSGKLYNNLPLDGDLVPVVAPIKWYKDVYADPFGIEAILQQKKYGGAGRIGSYVSTQLWYRYGHQLMSLFSKDAVAQLYATATSFALLLQLLYLFVLYLYARGKEFSWLMFIMLSAVGTVFIQYNDHYEVMGLIDRSSLYCFFYLWPILLLLLYFYPIYRCIRHDEKIKTWQHVAMLLIVPFLALGGPLMQPIVFIACMLMIVAWSGFLPLLAVRWKKDYGLHIVYLLSFCLYGYYVAGYNSESAQYKPLLERYALWTKGLGHMFSYTNALWIMCLSIGVYYALVRRFRIVPLRPIHQVLAFCGLFILAYLLLLPFGGYRPYRPFIIRYDTFIPVTLLLVFMQVYLLRLLFENFAQLGRMKIPFSLYILFFVAYFSYMDRRTEAGLNDCQRNTLQTIAQSNDTNISLTVSCNILSWDDKAYRHPPFMDALNLAFQRWGITEPEQTVELRGVE